jgi:tetratricopeptide (TPR) repeat protein
VPIHRRLLVITLTFGFSLLIAAPSHGQLPTSSGVTAPKDAPDPLAVGKSAMDHDDYASAKTFFTTYVHENPSDAEAFFLLGGTDLHLEKYSDAAKDFQSVIALRPTAWTAHMNLALAFAEMQDWKSFDEERAPIKAARDAKTPGLSLTDHDLIDVLRVGGKVYQVWYFYTPYGHFHARYIVLHFDDSGKADFYIQCESDDIDQAFFREKHKKQADAGERSYSLDSYDLRNNGQTQAVHQFYMDGEPTYETVRADVMKILIDESKAPAVVSAPSRPTQ